MKPKTSPCKNRSLSLIEVELTSIISTSHELVKVSDKIDWDKLEEHFGQYFSEKGRKAISTRLMIALHYLKYLNNLSDREVLAKWVENPYWQYFSGMKYFMHELPMDHSSMSNWRKRIKQAGAEKLLLETIHAGLKVQVITKSEIKNINVDTTVQEKNIRFPTDARLFHRSITNLVSFAKKHAIELRQTYTRTAKKHLILQQKYAHTKKHAESKKFTKKLKTILGRIVRELERKKDQVNAKGQKLLSICKRIHERKKGDSNKVYSVHEPDVSCIAKGKVHKKYEFGSKSSVATTNKSNFILGAVNFQGNPHDGKTLLPTLEQIKNFCLDVKNVFVDQGYKGHGVKEQTVHICKNQKKTSTRDLWKKIKRRAAIEPVIGHLKSDYRLNKNELSGTVGDSINLLFSCAAYNLKKILKKLREEVILFFFSIFCLKKLSTSPQTCLIFNKVR